ncbi:MAG TPA: DUF1287 domain-containing protein [bacterium]|nr:DUF1287 domain-containing protein [bacterium]
MSGAVRRTLLLSLVLLAALAVLGWAINRQPWFGLPDCYCTASETRWPAGLTAGEQTQLAMIVAAAAAQTAEHVTYDGRYDSIPYPDGDVPRNRGVCTDVIIRAWRAAGIDLQQLVHEDMQANFAAYPQLWQAARPDPNIDHRRVPNLLAFFQRHAQTLPVTENPDDYYPGDIIIWAGANHIGIVGDRRARFSHRPLIIHNITVGPVWSDCLFTWPVAGHFRYLPESGRALHAR